jgi:hypothetical protein
MKYNVKFALGSERIYKLGGIFGYIAWNGLEKHIRHVIQAKI